MLTEPLRPSSGGGGVQSPVRWRVGRGGVSSLGRSDVSLRTRVLGCVRRFVGILLARGARAVAAAAPVLVEGTDLARGSAEKAALLAQRQ